MANTKISALTEETAPITTDIVAIVDDPSGTPVTKKTTIANLSKGINASNIATGTLTHERGGLEADVSAYSGLLSITGGATASVTTKAGVEALLSDVADIAEADGDTYTGVHDFGGATSLEIPNGTAPTVDAAGEIALDTNGDGASITTGVVTAHDGTRALYLVGATNYPSTDNDVPAYDSATNSVIWQSQTGSGGGINNVVEDTTPQLGGQLDVNGNAIGDGTRELITFTEDASAVNHVNIENEATGSGPIISAAGDDTNVDLNLAAKGSGAVKIGGNAVIDAGDTASTTASGVIEIATSAETNTGTDATRAVSPDGLAGSNFGIRYMQVELFGYTTDCATGDGKAYFHVPPGLNGMNLVYAHAEVTTAGTTGTMDIQIHETVGAVDMLSTKLTIDSGETGSDTAATAYVINTANDDVATNDWIRIDVDAVHTTAAKGCTVTLGFQLP